MASPATTERFIRALHGAFEKSATDPRATAVVAEAFRGIQTSPRRARDVPERLPACAYLDPALAAISSEEELREICEAFKGITEDLVWYSSQMPCDAQTASDNFPMGHANAMIYGPTGLVLSEKLKVGVSLLAPFVRHPDHHHRPAEMYLVVSEGEFRQGEGEWVSPGNRGTLYNPSHSIHAMRSGPKPLLAFWALAHEL